MHVSFQPFGGYTHESCFELPEKGLNDAVQALYWENSRSPYLYSCTQEFEMPSRSSNSEKEEMLNVLVRLSSWSWRGVILMRCGRANGYSRLCWTSLYLMLHLKRITKC